MSQNTNLLKINWKTFVRVVSSQVIVRGVISQVVPLNLPAPPLNLPQSP